jgi:formate/nitrite transporter FocA (FNT family)
MFKNHPIKSYLLYSVIAAVAYFIVVCIYLRYPYFSSIWMLFVGNILFAIVIAIFIWMYNRTRRENANTSLMVAAGHITTVMGILIACALILLTYLLFPHLINGVPKGNTAFAQAPPQMEGRGDSFIFNIFMDAIIGNISAGSFISIILPYTAKRNQKQETPVMKTNTSDLAP